MFSKYTKDWNDELDDETSERLDGDAQSYQEFLVSGTTAETKSNPAVSGCAVERKNKGR